MTVIRFSRHGSKKRPYFRIVVQDKTKPRDGRFIEHIGSFIPTKGQETFSVKRDRLDYWLSVGAQLSNSVENRLKVLRRQWGSGATGNTPPQVVADKSTKGARTKKETA